MIEAVNSVVANALLLRGSLEQTTGVRSFAANPDRVQEVPKAPYVSPHISVDTDYDRAVLQIRDSNTGDVLKQFPTEAALRARQGQEISEAQDVPEVDTDSFQAGGASYSAPDSSTGFAQGQTPDVQFSLPDFTPSAPGAAEAHRASEALITGAQSGVPSSSGDVSVTA